MSKVAMILAGGKGTRLFDTEYPKALVRLVIPPVIEVLTDTIFDKLFFKEPDARICIVTTEQWRSDFERWLDAYRKRLQKRGMTAADSNNRIKLVIEESDLNRALFDGYSGTLPALYRTLDLLKTKDWNWIEEGEPVLVLNGDNYFEDDLQHFLQQSTDWLETGNCFCVIGAHRLSNYKDARSFGVIRPGGDDLRIADLVEKPEKPTPADCLISTGCYAFRNDRETRKALEDFLIRQRETRSDSIDARPVPVAVQTPPVVDIAYFIKNRIDDGWVARYVELLGAWFDIGTKAGLAQAVSHYVRTNIDPVRTVRDLVGRSHEIMADRVFVVLRPSRISIDGRRLRIQLRGEDELAVTPKPQVLAEQPWVENLARAIDSSGGGAPPYQPLGPDDPALYISGGVLLIDTADAADGLYRKRSRIPLQRRDFGAKLDPDRLTMPAGGLDSLSLKTCCYAEMQEEMVFYGDAPGSRRILYYLNNHKPDCRPLSRQAFVEYVLSKDLSIPGIDPVSLKLAQTDAALQRELIQQVSVNEVDLSSYPTTPNVWDVSIELDGEEMERDWFFVTLDRRKRTLECRKLAWADLSGVDSNESGSASNNLYGRLAGIADGEGFGRVPILFGADALLSYWQRIKNLTQAELLEYILAGPDDLVKVLCSGQPGSGRFSRFNFPLPIITTTPAVGAILPLLDQVFLR